MLIGLLAGAMIFTWFYNSTGGSVLMVAVWHGAFNTVTACIACKSGLIAPIVSTVVMVWAVNIAIDYQKTHSSEKRTRNLPARHSEELS
jgi:hypothetical protein